jgi:hypothetical protein
LTDGIGPLRTIRLQRRLSLRDVEERSLRFAQEWGNEAYRISAKWLDSLERGERDMPLSTLIVLANIYNLPAAQLIRSVSPGSPHAGGLGDLSAPNGAGRDRTTETTVLPAGDGNSPVPVKRGIIGKDDRTLYPLVPPGSIVYIDTTKHAIPTRRNWADEFQRPIFFLLTRDAYICGWCELEEDSQWLTVIPHPLSPVSIWRLKYRTEIENVGRVVAVIALTAE